jgi:hypothetical protein
MPLLYLSTTKPVRTDRPNHKENPNPVNGFRILHNSLVVVGGYGRDQQLGSILAPSFPYVICYIIFYNTEWFPSHPESKLPNGGSWITNLFINIFVVVVVVVITSDSPTGDKRFHPIYGRVVTSSAIEVHGLKNVTTKVWLWY